MIFKSPSWVPELLPPPDSIPVSGFILNEKYGRRSLKDSRDPYTCGFMGKSYTTAQVRRRRDYLAKALGEELGWHVNGSCEFDKVGVIFSLNTIDLMMISWAIHRLNGISSPANAVYSASELAFQLKSSRAMCIFTCISLLPTALESAKIANIPTNRIYLCTVSESTPRKNDPACQRDEELGGSHFKRQSSSRIGRPELDCRAGEAANCVYMLFERHLGITGVQISHYNIISNVLQRTTFESPWRKKHTNDATEVVMGCLPFSHIYGLVLICHTSTYRGDQVIVLPKFEFTHFLKSIERFKIYELFVIPPIVVLMTKNLDMLRKYDLSSVKFLYTGAAPLGKESVKELQSAYRDWEVCQAYGLTESATVVSSTSRADNWHGSSGSLLPGAEVRIVSADRKDIDEYDTPGELWVKAPSIVIGYCDNEKATRETFVEDKTGRWLKTGDEGEIRVSPESANEHVWIVDRIKELIKVNGNQVAPAELESHLLSHPFVADCAVISIPHETSGEAPKAYIVKSKAAGSDAKDEMYKRDIMNYVKEYKTKYKWVQEIEFIEGIPKSPSGETLRRILRDSDRAERKKQSIRAKI